MADNIPISGSTFVLSEPPQGFGVKFMRQVDGKIIGTVSVDGAKEGPPKHVHGGALASLIDEAMGASCWTQGYKVLAANLNINYRLPVPLHIEITITAEVDQVKGRKVFTKGAIILPDGRVATDGTGLFIVAPDLFIKANFDPFKIESSK